MIRHHVHGKIEITGAGQPGVDFPFSVFADDTTQARAAVEPLIVPWPHLVLEIEREAQPGPRPSRSAGPVCIACGCDELHACRTAQGHGCSWVLLNRPLGAGLCSECALELGFDPTALLYAAFERHTLPRPPGRLRLLWTRREGG